MLAIRAVTSLVLRWVDIYGCCTCQKASYKDSPVTAKMPRPPIHTRASVRYSSDSTLLKLHEQL